MPNKVLILDDEAAPLEDVNAALTSADFDVVRVNSAKGAIRLVETRQYAVVCCDVGVGQGTGLDFLSRSAAAHPGVGLLLIASSDELRASKEQAEDDDHPEVLFKRKTASSDRVPGLRVLLKPFDAEQIIATVTHVARMAEMRRSTHAMSSVVGPGRSDDDPLPSDPPPPRSLFPRKS